MRGLCWLMRGVRAFWFGDLEFVGWVWVIYLGNLCEFFVWSVLGLC